MSMIYTDEIVETNGIGIDRNAKQIEEHLAWLELIIQVRLDQYFGHENVIGDIYDLQAPKLDQDNSMFSLLIHHYDMSVPERIAFMIAIVPFVRPQIFDVFFQTNKNASRGYTEFGGIKGESHGGFLPTGETVLFILSGNDLSLRLELQKIFDVNHFFASHKMAQLEAAPLNEPKFCGQWLLTSQILDLITSGAIQKPNFSQKFPARVLTTSLTWEDLILNDQTQEQLKELEAWMLHEGELMKEWGMGKVLKPGFRCLFFGPSGTGKTLTATLMGKRYNREVYRVDLSSLVSKYIGETEKNLERIFERTELLDCILFFDEADAVFGKRGSVNEAHDRYANQEISYLLQRIEDYDGVIILASNLIGNMDDAFMRRFQSTVFFPIPDARERTRLWEDTFSTKAIFEQGLNFNKIGESYKLSGGSIVNIVRYASLAAIQRRECLILESDILKGIRREFQKEGKLV